MVSSTLVAQRSEEGTERTGGAESAWSPTVTGVLFLVLAVVSVSSAVAVCLTDIGPFVASNQATPAERSIVFRVLFIAAAVSGLAFGLAAWLGSSRVKAALGKWGLRLAPLSLTYAVPVFAAYHTWVGHPLQFLMLLATTTLLFEGTLRLSFRQGWREFGDIVADIGERVPLFLRRYGPSMVVLAAATAYTAYTAYYSIQQHQRLATLAFDLGIYDNLLYNAWHGFFFRSPVLFGPDGGNYIAGHAEFIMVLYAPLYALWPRAEMLLVMQSFLLGFAAFPLYKFARTQLPPWAAVVVAVGYLLYAPLHGPNFYDFHWLPTAIFFHFWLYFAIATSRTWLAVLCVILCCLVREDVPVGLALLGAFLALTGVRVRFGIFLAAFSVAYFGVVKFVIMPWAGNWFFANFYKDLIPPGESGYGGVIRTLLTNPSYFLGTLLEKKKLIYALQMFAPVALLPLRRPVLALLASAGFFFTLMTTGYEPTLSISFQYTTHWIPYIFAATVLCLRSLGKVAVNRRAATGAFAFAMLSHSYVFGAILQQETFVGGFGHVPFAITGAEQRRYEDIRALARMIPNGAVVAATESELPHISNRMTAYGLRDHHGGADYLLVNKNMMGHVNTRKALTDAFATYTYGLVDRRSPLYLFKREYTSPSTASAKLELGIP
jgi:uncharacterized membrane protein